jgi:hypothetical protein
MGVKIFNHLPPEIKSMSNDTKSFKLKLTTFLLKLRGLSPQANYTDRATAAVGEVVPTFADRGVLRGQRNEFPRPLISVF